MLLQSKNNAKGSNPKTLGEELLEHSEPHYPEHSEIQLHEELKHTIQKFTLPSKTGRQKQQPWNAAPWPRAHLHLAAEEEADAWRRGSRGV
jgi:hypothetical protein